MECWFEWKGERCEAMGIRAVSVPLSLAKERVKYQSVAGRSGDLALLEGANVYDDLLLSVDCRVNGEMDLHALGTWLRGSGELRLSTRPEGCYLGRVSNQLDFLQLVKGHALREFTIDFRCAPYLRISDDADIEIASSGANIHNPYNLPALPRLAVYGSGDFMLSLGGQVQLLTNIDGGILLDSELQDALTLDGAALVNDCVSGDFFTLPSGDSALSWTPFDGNDNAGSVSRIVVSPRWRCR